MGPDFRLYRLVRPDGTGKEWAYRDNQDGTVTTRWRKLGARSVQESTRKMERFARLDALVRSKERKGYVLVSRIASPSLHPIPETREPEEGRRPRRQSMKE